jgi:hypothetical protein
MSQPRGSALPSRSVSTTAAPARPLVSTQIPGRNQRVTSSAANTPVASTEKENTAPIATKAELIKVSIYMLYKSLLTIPLAIKGLASPLQ